MPHGTATGHGLSVIDVRPDPATFGGGSIVFDHRSVKRRAGDDGTNSGSKGKEQKLVDLRHPEWSAMHADWTKWRLTYQGGREFIDAFLTEYSRREDADDFGVRKALTYNENHAGSLIDIIRNALMVKMPEVTRIGDPAFEELAESNVDMNNSSMSTFVGLEVVPLLLAVGKRLVGVDAPQILNRAMRTRADDDGQGQPYVWAVDAEDLLSWSHDDDMEFTSTLTREHKDVRDPATGLIVGAREQFRLMVRVDEGFAVAIPDGLGGTVEVPGPGVLVRTLDGDDDDIEPPQVLGIPKIPLVEFRLVESLLIDIADMQVAHMNLSSTDMSFLFRGNFPIYTEQYDKGRATIKPLGSRSRVRGFDQEISDRDRVVEEDERPRVREPGNQRGVRYPTDTERPGFIAPTTENLKASMAKQDALAQGMRSLLNLSLVSLTVKAAEQSGKSKEADRVGEEAALAYIAGELETGERGVSDHMHQFLGVPDAERDTRYPVGHSLKTAEDRRAEADELGRQRGSVRSATYKRSIDKRIAEVLLKNQITPEELERIRAEIDEAAQFDDNADRAEMLQKDAAAGFISKEDGERLRMLPEGSAAAAEVERELEAERLAGALPSDVPPLEE